jgi:hypothetical protein
MVILPSIKPFLKKP